MPVVSVVIPCYNQGRFLHEALSSLGVQTFRDFEILVVNDGSDDPGTLRVLENLDNRGLSVLHTKNKGLAEARNYGIRHAVGKYILPLDADDMLSRNYMAELVPLLERHPHCIIAYGAARYFGCRNKEWRLPPYSLVEMLRTNIIYCSAIFRKVDWEKAGGYDPACRYGLEDYDFWLTLLETGGTVMRNLSAVFFYRQHAKDSMRKNMIRQGRTLEMLRYIRQKHSAFFQRHILETLEVLNRRDEELLRLSGKRDRTMVKKVRRVWDRLRYTYQENRHRLFGSGSVEKKRRTSAE